MCVYISRLVSVIFNVRSEFNLEHEKVEMIWGKATCMHESFGWERETERGAPSHGCVG
jgi:hypothetical protein